MRNVLIIAALLAAPAAVMAEGISYTYVDARYFSTDSDALSADQQGAIISGSFALSPIFYVAGDGQFGQSERIAVGASSGRFDTISGSARIGAHHALTPTLDIIADGGMLYSEFKGKGAFNGQSDDDIGYTAQAGLRLALVPQVEVSAFYAYQDVLDSDNSFFTADLQYHFTDHVSLVGSATNARSVDFYTVGARYRF